MPELPEVETVRSGLEPLLVGRRLLDGAGHPSPKFASAVEAVGGTVDYVRRRGKYLIIGLDGGRELVVHLGMTGQLRVVVPGSDPGDGPHVRAWWSLDDGRRLVFRDIRRFGRLRVVPAGCYGDIPTLHRSGPEPFDEGFTVEGEDRWGNTTP